MVALVGNYTRFILPLGGYIYFGKGGGLPLLKETLWQVEGRSYTGCTLTELLCLPSRNGPSRVVFRVEAAKIWMGYIPTWCEPLGKVTRGNVPGLLACFDRKVGDERETRRSPHLRVGYRQRGTLRLVDGPWAPRVYLV